MSTLIPVFPTPEVRDAVFRLLLQVYGSHIERWLMIFIVTIVQTPLRDQIDWKRFVDRIREGFPKLEMTVIWKYRPATRPVINHLIDDSAVDNSYCLLLPAPLMVRPRRHVDLHEAIMLSTFSFYILDNVKEMNVPWPRLILGGYVAYYAGYVLWISGVNRKKVRRRAEYLVLHLIKKYELKPGFKRNDLIIDVAGETMLDPYPQLELNWTFRAPSRDDVIHRYDKWNKWVMEHVDERIS